MLLFLENNLMISNWKTFWVIAVLALILSACGNEQPSREGAKNPASSNIEGSDEDETESFEINLSDIAAEAAGIKVDIAGYGQMGEVLILPAEVRFDADRIARISPQIGGIVRKLYATEGDVVARGERLALLSSRELADLKSDYISAKAASELAQTTLNREETLWANKITSQADLLSARATVSATNASLQAVKNKLKAIGVNSAAINSENNGSNYLVTSPLAGTIVQRSVALGEAVSAEDTSADPLFTIADDAVVWIDITIFKQDLARVNVGTKVRLVDDNSQPLVLSEIAFISPIVDQASRTATARVIVENTEGRLKHGQFVRARINLGEDMSVIRVPQNAVQTVSSTPSIFVPTDSGFKPVPVVTGIERDGYVGILRGLEEGQRYVATGAFTLKSQLEKDSFGADED
jgi:cobalt-zinc-cadmium efflux system membrane fusion protein